MEDDYMKHSLTRVLSTAVIAASITASAVSAQTGVVTADMLNVRTSPSTSSEIAGSLYGGDQVSITYNAGDWYEIYRNGDCYYVNANYVDCGGSYSGSKSYGSYSGSKSYGNYSGYTDSSDDYSGYTDSSDDYSYYNYTDSTDDYSYDNTDSSDDYSYDDPADSYDESGSTDYSDTSYEESPSSGSSSSGTYLGNFTLTAYCNCEICCGTAGNPTASGVYPTAGHTVAMGGVPFGTQLMINGTVYTVEDRGTPYGHVDIFFNSHSEALAFGLQSADVYQLN